jgi:hypothetical protein
MLAGSNYGFIGNADAALLFEIAGLSGVNA